MEPAAWQTLLGRYRDYRDEHPPIMIPGKKTGPGTGSRYLSIADRLLVCVLKRPAGPCPSRRWRPSSASPRP